MLAIESIEFVPNMVSGIVVDENVVPDVLLKPIPTPSVKFRSPLLLADVPPADIIPVIPPTSIDL
jgi:hypothetical protein